MIKRRVKFLAAAGASAVLSLTSAITGLAATGWVNNGNNWQYYKADGTVAANQWVKSGEYWYWIEASGVMGTNMWINNQNQWYYVGEDGASVKGWRQINGKWYFFFNDFTMATNTMIDSYKVGKDGAWVES